MDPFCTMIENHVSNLFKTARYCENGRCRTVFARFKGGKKNHTKHHDETPRFWSSPLLYLWFISTHSIHRSLLLHRLSYFHVVMQVCNIYKTRF